MASTEGCTSSETRASRPLLDSWPSNRMRNVPVGAPLTLMVFQPEMLAPGVSWVKDSGLRMAPAPMPKLIGRELILVPETVVDCSALSVFSMEARATTSTVCTAWPTWSDTSRRVVTATWTRMLACSNRLKPAASTESR